MFPDEHKTEGAPEAKEGLSKQHSGLSRVRSFVRRGSWVSPKKKKVGTYSLFMSAVSSPILNYIFFIIFFII